MQMKFEIYFFCHVWLFGTLSNYHNLHRLQKILLWYVYSYEIDENASDKKYSLYNYSVQARRNENNSGGKVLEVYQKMSANLVSWLSRSFHGNILKCPEILNRVEVGNANSQHK